MAALLMGPDQAEALRSVRRHAEAHPVPLAEVFRRYEHREPVLDGACICDLPVGFRVVFTVEQHPAGWTRHLSVSGPTPGRLPNSYAMMTIGRALGMRMMVFDPTAETYFEGPEKAPYAVNVIEPMEFELETEPDHADADAGAGDAAAADAGR